MITFTVYGAAVAKGRPRFANGAVRTPERTRRYEEVVQAAAVVAMGNRPPLDGAVCLMVVESRAIPAGWSKARRQAALDGRERPCSKPDADNVVKTIKDALNKIAYHDDAQVCQMHVEKRYGVEPQVVVTVQPCA